MELLMMFLYERGNIELDLLLFRREFDTMDSRLVLTAT